MWLFNLNMPNDRITYIYQVTDFLFFYLKNIKWMVATDWYTVSNSTKYSMEKIKMPENADLQLNTQQQQNKINRHADKAH